jgi:DNA-binding transcriptional LysR family regulator
LADSSLKARKIGEFRQLTVCLPQIAATLKRGAAPDALSNLPFIANTVLRNPLAWRFSKGRETRSIRLAASLAVNATMAVHAATLVGGGFSILPDFVVAPDLKAGRLVALVSDWHLPKGGIYLVFPKTLYRPPKTTAFTEILSQHFLKG